MLARRVFAVLMALALGLLVARLSQAPTSYAGPGDALLRLSWRVGGYRIEECRPRTEEELRALAPHMRTPEVCTGGGVDFELRVGLDGSTVLVDTLGSGGARRDRPIYLYRDLDITPGRHALDVSFAPLLPESFEPDDAPPVYRFDGPIEVAEHEVALITLDATGTRLVRLDP